MCLFHVVQRGKLSDILDDIGKLDFVLVAVQGLAVGKVFAHGTLQSEHVVEAARVKLELADITYLLFLPDATFPNQYLFTNVLKILSCFLTKNRLNFSTWQ